MSTLETMPMDAGAPDGLAAFFSADYRQARERFVRAASEAGARLWHVEHPLTGLQGEALAMDLAWLGPRGASRVLVSLSGTHGVEGFAGSACQLAWLSGAQARTLPPDTAVLMVHAVNPWGLSWLRRTDELNVDVNRNAIDPSQPAPDNPDYPRFHPLLVAAQTDAQARARFPEGVGELMAELGPRRATRAITGGQYSHPDGLFYGGACAGWSVRTLAQQARQVLQQARLIAVLDHHTGLGPAGHTEIICRHPPGSPALAQARRWWGPDTTAAALGESTSEVIDGNIRMALVAWCPQALVVAAALEVGTVSGEAVLQALVADHWLHQAGAATGPGAEAVRQGMRAAFDPPETGWRLQCLTRSLALYQATLQGLQSVDMPQARP